MMIEKLAELYLTNKQYTEAFATYQQALATYETAIQHLEVADTREQAIVYWSNTKLGCKSSHPFSPMRRICHQLSKLLGASVFKLQHHAATSGVTPSILELLAFRDYGKIQDYAGETWLTLKQDLLQTLRNQPDLGIREAQVDIFLHEGLINDAIKTVERDTYYDSKLVH
ncbi:MAG: hypothetical protein V7L01_34890 [Nostoc sp.]|uniref:hypothetical protein n=1 Tax=Nostoc sp. TaxID=1180 RepID=UPI002FFBD100